MRHTRHVPGEKIQAMHMSKSPTTISDDGSLLQEGMFSALGLFTRHALDLRIRVIKGRCNILEIPVDDDSAVGQVPHNGQDGIVDKKRRIRLSLPSPGEEERNAPNHSYDISIREVAAPTEALKELAPRQRA